MLQRPASRQPFPGWPPLPGSYRPPCRRSLGIRAPDRGPPPVPRSESFVTHPRRPPPLRRQPCALHPSPCAIRSSPHQPTFAALASSGPPPAVWDIPRVSLALCDWGHSHPDRATRRVRGSGPRHAILAPAGDSANQMPPRRSPVALPGAASPWNVYSRWPLYPTCLVPSGCGCSTSFV